MDPSGKRILVVEDDAKSAEEIRRLLEGAGYPVDVVFNGMEALSKARTTVPDLILLDVLLPKMSGFQVARLLKFSEATKKIPIVMLTILNRPADEKKGREMGVDLYLTKPFTQKSLLEAIRRFIP